MLKRKLLNDRVVYVIFSIIVVTALLFGCTNKTETNNDVDAVVFTDSLGREVSVHKNPGRVAALIGGFADVWVLAGGELCAAPEDAWDDFGLSLENAVNLGGAHSPNTETLLASNPDFVIASSSTASNVALKDVLENSGIIVAYFDVDNFKAYLSMLDVCTDITGRKDLYKKNGIEIRDKIEKLKSEFKNAKLTEKERTVLLLRVSSGSVKTKGSKGTVLGEMLSELGCINIADNDKTLLENLNVESIINNEPYHIFVVAMGKDNRKVTDNLLKMVTESHAWSSLSAIKEDRIHIMDRNLFHIKPNEKWDESYEQLSRILLEKQ